MGKVQKPTGQVYFREQQKYTHIWIYIAMFAGGIIPVSVLYFLMEMRGSITFNQFVVAVPIIMIVIVINTIFLLKANLETIVTDAGLYIRWQPFHRKYLEYRWKNIMNISLKKRAPISPNPPHAAAVPGAVYTMQSSVGLELTLDNGKQVFVGTEKQYKLVSEVSKFRRVNDQLKHKK